MVTNNKDQTYSKANRKQKNIKKNGMNRVPSSSTTTNPDGIRLNSADVATCTPTITTSTSIMNGPSRHSEESITTVIRPRPRRSKMNQNKNENAQNNTNDSHLNHNHNNKVSKENLQKSNMRNNSDGMKQKNKSNNNEHDTCSQNGRNSKNKNNNLSSSQKNDKASNKDQRRNASNDNKNNENYRTKANNSQANVVANSNKAKQPRKNNKKPNKAVLKNQILPYPKHWKTIDLCYQHYYATTKASILQQQEQEPKHQESDPNQKKHINIIRGKLRVLSGASTTTSTTATTTSAASFVSCDRGWIDTDICIPGALERNRSMDGDTVFVELIQMVQMNESDSSSMKKNLTCSPTTSINTTANQDTVINTVINSVSDDDEAVKEEEEEEHKLGIKNDGSSKNKKRWRRKNRKSPSNDKNINNISNNKHNDKNQSEQQKHVSDDKNNGMDNIDDEDGSDSIIQILKRSKEQVHGDANKTRICDAEIKINEARDEQQLLWQDDEIQMDLWNPQVPVQRKKEQVTIPSHSTSNQQQWRGRVVYIEPPKITTPGEIRIQEERSSNLTTADGQLSKNQKKPKDNRSDSNNNDAKSFTGVTSKMLYCRTIVGTLHKVESSTTSSYYLLNPMNKSLPQFKVTPSISDEQVTTFIELAKRELQKREQGNAERRQRKSTSNHEHPENGDSNTNHDTCMEKQLREERTNEIPPTSNTTTTSLNQIIVQAVYEYGSWRETYEWPPCYNVQYFGRSCIIENEINALLMQYNIYHNEQHPAAALDECQQVVQSGLFPFLDSSCCTMDTADAGHQINWKPTPEMMYVNNCPGGSHQQRRRDYRNHRVFTIDPTSAKDLDDAVHIRQISDTVVEIGVHIADVSYFVDPVKTPNLDAEARNRATTVYLVDRTIPMLPRPLCEIACSLNENVERLAFSCVWQMNIDGTMRLKQERNNWSEHTQNPEEAEKIEVWYGRTVIKSCARLDYLTAQNIIDGKICCPEVDSTWAQNEEQAEQLWPSSRRPVPSCIHTMDQIAADVRLLHKVAMARRKLRFLYGALELNSTKLTFQLDPIDRQTPLLASPYPVRDSNRLIEEYMLLANYLVAQRLIQYCGDRACLRHHPAPLPSGLGEVKKLVKKAIPDYDFDLDVSSSQALQYSLWTLSEHCRSLASRHSKSGTATKMVLVQQCITQLLMIPMQPAEYIAAGLVPEEDWNHFALNIPYYTHFTSPIRRYPDIIVHRLLQESIDAENDTYSYPAKEIAESATSYDTKTTFWDVKTINEVCTHCNERRMESKYAQERCDRIFLALYVRDHPLQSQLGIVLSVGVSTFTVFVPSLGVEAKLFLQEHLDQLTFHSPTPTYTTSNSSDDFEHGSGSSRTKTINTGRERKIILRQKELFTSTTIDVNIQYDSRLCDDEDTCEPLINSNRWDTLEVQVFTKLKVAIICKDTPPIDVKLRLEGPWDK